MLPRGAPRAGLGLHSQRGRAETSSNGFAAGKKHKVEQAVGILCTAACVQALFGLALL